MPVGAAQPRLTRSGCRGAASSRRVVIVRCFPRRTPLIPATIPGEQLGEFGAQAPLGRAAQPAELAPFYVFLASGESGYMTGEVLGATGGTPIT